MRSLIPQWDCVLEFYSENGCVLKIFIILRVSNKQGGKDKGLFLVQGGPEKAPWFVFHPKVVFHNFFPYFSGGVDSMPGRFFWHQKDMDPNGRYTTQQRIKIIEVYFTTKSVLLAKRQCRRDLGRNNVPDRRTIQRLVAKFRKTKCGRWPQRSTSFIVRHNSWEYSKFTGTPWGIPQKINTLSVTRNCYLENVSFEDPLWGR